MRAALYVRLSEETTTTTSPERQRDAARKYAESRGWNVVGTFEDVDVSATHRRLDRPGLDRLRAEVAASRVDVVIVYRLDRLARNVMDSLTLLEEWRQLGAAIVSTSEGIDATTPAGKAMFTLVAVFAELEADAISARVKASVDRLRGEGRFAGGVVPYGYSPQDRLDGPGRALVQVPAEVEVVREAAARVLAGEAPYRVCRDLNDRKVPAPGSGYRKRRDGTKSKADPSDIGEWTVRSLVNILTGDAVLGRVVRQGTPVLDATGLPQVVWAPILTVSDSAALRAAVAPARPGRVRRVRAARVLSGTMRCAECDGTMYVRAASDGRAIYGCSTKSRGGRCDSAPRVSAARAEEHVVSVALERFGDLAMTETVSTAQESSIGIEYAETERALKDAAESMTRPGADVAALAQRVMALQAHRADLAARGAEVTVVAVVRPTGTTWRQDWHALTDDDARRRFLAEWVRAVRVLPGRPGSRAFNGDRLSIEFVDV